MKKNSVTVRKKKPSACRISGWDSCTEIIYQCPVCGVSFSFYGPNERYCHNCGQEIDWNVYLMVNNHISDLYHKDKRHAIIKVINYINTDLDVPMEFAEFTEEKEKLFSAIMQRIEKEGEDKNENKKIK